MWNEEYLGVAFEHGSLSGTDIVPRIYLGSKGDVVKVIEGFTQELTHAIHH